MCLHHPLDGRVLADGDPPPPHHLHDAHGSAPDAGDHVHRSVTYVSRVRPILTVIIDMKLQPLDNLCQCYF